MSPALHRAAGVLKTSRPTCRCSVRLHLFLLPSVGCRPYSRRGDGTRPYSSPSTSNELSGNQVFEELLDEATSLLVRLRGQGKSSDGQVVDDLIRAKERLRESKSLKTHVSVFCTTSDSLSRSASADLVSALLEDPLSDDNERRRYIRDRWDSIDQVKSILEFEYGPTKECVDNRMHLPSPRLSQIPIILSEQFSLDDISQLSSSDVPILVLHPLQTTNIPWSRMPVSNPRFLVVINATATHATQKGIEDTLRSESGGNNFRVLFVDTTLALEAIDTLRSDPTSSKTIQKYQDNFNGSKFNVLLEILSKDASEISLETRMDASYSLVTQMLRTAQQQLRGCQEEMDEARCVVSTLKESYLEERESSLRDAIGSDVENTMVADRIGRAGKEMKVTFDSLEWWRLPLIVDDITRVVSDAAEKAYTSQFKDQLIFLSGRLSALQHSFIARTSNAMQTLPVSFRSPVLHNAIAQQSSHPSFAITPSILLTPIQTRLSQLKYATNRLHRSAQRLLVTTFSASALSAASGYGLWAAAYLDVSTSFGGATLVALLALRYAVGRWESAKKSWWQDWTRVGQGLGRELSSSLKTTMDEHVFVVPMNACQGLGDLIEKRRTELVSIDEEICRLSSKLNENRTEGEK